MPRPTRRRQHAFTIVELMIVLVVMGVLVMAVAPSLSSMLADNRQASAAYDIVRFARRARAMAVSTGYAHLLRIDPAQPDGLGTITLYAGMNNKCVQTPWNATLVPVALSGLGPSEIFDMAEYNTTNALTRTDTAVIRFEVRVNTAVGDPQGGRHICYQPNGETYQTADLNTTPAFISQIDSILLTVRRRLDGVEQGMERQVLFPPNGNARLR